jgi:hypothetical protein
VTVTHVSAKTLQDHPARIIGIIGSHHRHHRLASSASSARIIGIIGSHHHVLMGTNIRYHRNIQFSNIF